MPLYEFDCTTCGPFDAWRTIAEAGLPTACPRCGGEGRRRFSVGAVGLPSPRTRTRIERAREPRVVGRERRDEPPARVAPKAAAGRPWQISH